MKSGLTKPGDDGEYELQLAFLIDGKGYTDRDRLLFVCGYEYAQNHAFLMTGSETAWPRLVHKENEFRLRNLISKFGRTYKFTPVEDMPEWMTLDVGPIVKEGK